MPSNGKSAWLFFRDLDLKEWARTPCGGEVQTLGGIPVQDAYVPGLLFRFEGAANAARAALRCHAELKRILGGGDVPPVVVDFGERPRTLPVIAHGLPANLIIVTDAALRFLAVEPLERAPGPMVGLETGETVRTELLGTGAHNLGWALPSLGFDQGRPLANRERPAPIINVHMEKPPQALSIVKSLPWKWAFAMMLVAVLLLGAYRALQLLVRGDREAPTNTEALIPMVDADNQGGEEAVELVPTPEVIVTQAPEGFGTIVVQTKPTGAMIFLNGKYVGKGSPLTLEKKSNRETYTLTVKRSGYDVYTTLFNLEANERKLIDVQLTKP